MLNEDVISMPDKWEYPWYAAWDLAFHALPLSIADPDFAKSQMKLMLRGSYLHPTGQMPAYEWNFSDVNPPVHAFATLFLHRTEQALRGEVDLEFLTATFNKLVLNFTWWVNRKDRFGKNVFEGGFLGLDNIGVFDGAHRCRPAGTSNRRTARPGWPSSARTCWNWPWSWPRTTRRTKTWCRSSSSTFLHRARHEPRGRRTACGTRRTASTTTCCASRTDDPRV
jgi:hypothetical protein